MKGWVASCASSAAIIDDFPPHAWQGPNACARLGERVHGEREAEWNHRRNGDAWIQRGTSPSTGEHAYAVYPATYTYKQHGKSMKDSGTFASSAAENLRLVG